MGTLWHNIRHGFRMLRRNPGFTAVVVITLALGIGVNTAVFNVAEWLCLRRAPFADPGRVVRLFAASEGRGEGGFSYPDYLALKEQMISLSGLTAIEYRGASLRREPWSRDLTVGVVSRDFFDVLGVRACLGRMFSEDDDDTLKVLPGVVISHELWRSQFGADPHVVGGPAVFSGRPHLILGVAPPEFTGERYTMPPDVWYPVETWGNPDERQSRDMRSFSLIGRLRTGVSLQDAQKQAEVVFARLELKDSGTQAAQKPYLVSEPDYRLKGFGSYSLFRGAIAGLVLLIACANVSGLLLARAEVRSKEMAVRRSLGCTRVRLVQQLLAEGWMPSVLSLAASLLLAYWMIGVLRASLPPAASDPASGVRLNFVTVGFAVMIGLVATLVSGLLPALYASMSDPLLALKADTARAPRSGGTVCGLNALVVGQLATALVLVAATSLLFRSYLNCCAVDLGFDRKNILLTEVCPTGDLNRCQAFYRELLPRLRSVPGVKDASVGATAPYVFTQCGWTHQVFPLGGDNNGCTATYNVVAPHYFQTLGIPILRGRGFEDQDGRSPSKVAVINETMAKRLWPDQDPVGQFLRLGPASTDMVQVVGVIRDGRYRSITGAPGPYMYVPLGQEFSFLTMLLVKTEGNAPAVRQSVCDMLRKLDPDMDLYPLTPLADAIRDTMSGQKGGTELAGFLSFLGLVLACIGTASIHTLARLLTNEQVNVRTNPFTPPP